MGFASSQDVPGACWLGSGSPSWTQTPTQSNTMYQKLCSWGGKKNCSFTNVSLAKRKGNGGCNANDSSAQAEPRKLELQECPHPASFLDAPLPPLYSSPRGSDPWPQCSTPKCSTQVPNNEDYTDSDLITPGLQWPVWTLVTVQCHHTARVVSTKSTRHDANTGVVDHKMYYVI